MTETETMPAVAVIGAGLMGRGIAVDFLDAGHPVTLADISQTMLDQAPDALFEALSTYRGWTDRSALDRPLRTVSLKAGDGLEQALAGATYVAEAVAEDLGIKRKLYAAIDAATGPEVILASNTSTLMPSDLAAACRRHPERVLVAHYFNPAYLIPLVEIVPGPQTARDAVERTTTLLRQTGKTPVALNKEVPGFIVNRLQAALLREACALVEDGVVSAADLDTIMRTSMGRRWAAAGVFEVFDFGGWDVIHAVMANLCPDLADGKAVPSLIQARKDRDELGVKSGRGFYDWSDPDQVTRARRRIFRMLQEAERLAGKPPPALW
ncbi:MAG: 3-hydroxyacyl-CoA dehydrogenase family protein [Opitutales bacterium]